MHFLDIATGGQLQHTLFTQFVSEDELNVVGFGIDPFAALGGEMPREVGGENQVGVFRVEVVVGVAVVFLCFFVIVASCLQGCIIDVFSPVFHGVPFVVFIFICDIHIQVSNIFKVVGRHHIHEFL